MLALLRTFLCFLSLGLSSCSLGNRYLWLFNWLIFLGFLLRKIRIVLWEVRIWEFWCKTRFHLFLFIIESLFRFITLSLIIIHCVRLIIIFLIKRSVLGLEGGSIRFTPILFSEINSEFSLLFFIELLLEFLLFTYHWINLHVLIPLITNIWFTQVFYNNLASTIILKSQILFLLEHFVINITNLGQDYGF